MVDSDLVSIPSSPILRPPTPPRESHKSRTRSGLVERFFDSTSTRRSSAPPSILTPDSSAESPAATGSSRKKVGFSEWPTYNEPPTVTFDGKGVLKQLVQPLPPSSERKPTRSILKAHNGVQEQHETIAADDNTTLRPLHHYASFAKMLDSIVQQLSGNERSAKIDAYLMLCSSLKASENIPDVKALKERMGPLCKYIERDLTQKLENGKPDSTLVVNAILLLGCILHSPTIIDSIPTDFAAHLVDYCIKVFGDGSISKEATKHLMFVLAQQKFSARTMNQDRISRLVTVLHSIEDKVKGKSIVQNRLQIYRTLLRQSRLHMIYNTVWIEDLLTEMLSSLKDIRSMAITFGLEAALSLGMEPAISRTIVNIFKNINKDKMMFADYYIGRLETLTKTNDESQVVPQIWSVVILFLRSKPQQLEKWQFFQPFLNILQICFNMAHSPTKEEAHYAWNRLIFAVQPNTKTSPRIRAFLLSALSRQLRRSTSGRKRALSTVNTLLYYSFSPRSSHADLDINWDEYLVPLVEECLGPCKDVNITKQNAADMCTILRYLFDTTPRQWNETRAMDPLVQNSINACELPAIDSKWLRANHVRIFKVLGPLLKALYWDLAEVSPITKVWQAYIKSIASPAVAEIKVHIDTMSCIGSLFGTINEICGAGPATLGSLSAFEPSNKDIAFWKGLGTILTTAITGLGILAFTDRHLSIKHNNFVAVATPSALPTKQRLETNSPLYHLIGLLANPSAILAFDHGFSSLAHSIILPFFESRKTKSARLLFIKEVASLLPVESTSASKALWQTLAEFAAVATDSREKSESNTPSDLPLGTDYRTVVGILELGIQYSPQRPLPRWKVLFDALTVSAALDAGDSGKALAVIEPLAKAFRCRGPATDSTYSGLFYLSALVSKATYPKDKQALNAAERKLWGAVAGRTNSFDPYSELYFYITYNLDVAYRQFTKLSTQDYADIISSLTGLLLRCPALLVYDALSKLQSGIVLWIADVDARLSGGNPLGLAIIALWSHIGKLIPSLCARYTHNPVLTEFEGLLCAGLESKHKTIVNATISMWNSTFGACEHELQYPPKAKDALLKLYSQVELQLPFFPESLDPAFSGDHRQIVSLLHLGDESTQRSALSSLSSGMNEFQVSRPGPSLLQRVRQSDPRKSSSVGRTGSLKRSRDGTPEGSGRNAKRREVTPRLRHNDSQTVFTAIPSSSPVHKNDEVLTEKQREVRERQEADAAMFSDFRSSARPKSSRPESEDTEMSLPIHRSSSKIRERIAQPDRETTPNVLVPSDDDNNFVQSSPTPTRSKKGQVENPASSPPDSPVKHVVQIDGGISSSPPEGTPEPAIAGPVDDADIMAIEPREATDAPEMITPNKIDLSDDEDTVMDISRVDLESPTASEIDGSAHEDADNEDKVTDDAPAVSETKGVLGADDAEAGPSGSVEHSAQVESGAAWLKHTMPPYDISVSDRSSSPAEDPSDQLRASQLEHEEAIAREEANAAIVPPSVVDQNISHPMSPHRSDRDALPGGSLGSRATAQFQKGVSVESPSPRTPQYLDALSSPVESDKQDVFEDAVSSPRLSIPKLQRHPRSSSPLSEMDESSMLRVMAEYDQSSKKEVSSSKNKETSSRRTRSSLRNDVAGSPSRTSPASTRKSPSRKKSGLPQTSQTDKEASSPLDQHQPSLSPTYNLRAPTSSVGDPFKSIDFDPVNNTTMGIDDTGALEAPVIRYFDDDGVEVNMDETIIVDTSILEREGWFRVHKRSPRKKGGKRKRSIVTSSQDERIASSQPYAIEDESVILERSTPNRQSTPTPVMQEDIRSSSQAPLLESSGLKDGTPDNQAPPPAKRKRGRPKKISLSQDLRASIESQDSQPLSASQSIASVEINTSMADVGVKTDDARAAPLDKNSSDLAAAVSLSNMTSEAPAIAKDGANGHLNYNAGNEDAVMDTILDPIQNSGEVDVIEETTFDISSTINRPVSPVHLPETISKMDVTRCMDDNDEEGGPVAEARMPGIGMEGTGVKPAVTVQSMKTTLQSLMADLQSATLSRREVGELEDMFMDAKRLLYGAELRSRSSETPKI